MLRQINYEILKASKNDHNIWQTLRLIYLQLGRICWGYSATFFSYGFLFQVISAAALCSKNCNYHSYNFNYNFRFIPSFSFRKIQKQSVFRQVGGLVMKNSSIDFSLGILLYDIHFRIIDPWPKGFEVVLSKFKTFSSLTNIGGLHFKKIYQLSHKSFQQPRKWKKIV